MKNKVVIFSDRVILMAVKELANSSKHEACSCSLGIEISTLLERCGVD